MVRDVHWWRRWVTAPSSSASKVGEFSEKWPDEVFSTPSGDIHRELSFLSCS